MNREYMIAMMARAIKEASADGNWSVNSATAALTALESAGMAMRADVLEEAAKACEQQQASFLSDSYALHQTASTILERLACGQCAAAIRALAARTEDKG